MARLPHIHAMATALLLRPDDDDEAAELIALTEAVNRSRANTLGVPHADMRGWLFEIAAGNFDAKPPVAREL